MSAPADRGPRVHPPRLAAWLAGRGAPAGEREFLLGDLAEDFYAVILPARGARLARRWYWREAWRSALGRRRRRDGSPRPHAPKRSVMSSVVQDLRFALRLLRRSPGFTAVVLVTLGLGIGATTTIFSLVDAVLLKPLPFADPGRLVIVQNGGTLAEALPTSYPEYEDLRDAHALQSIAAYFTQTATITGTGRPETVHCVRASTSLFPTLGVQPLIGRLFTEAEEPRTAPRVALISESLWTRRFGGDVNALGRTLTLDDAPFTIVGVLPEWFHTVQPSEGGDSHLCDIWIPLRLNENVAPRSLNFMTIIGRIAPGQSLAQAHDALLASVVPKSTSSHPQLFVGPLRQSLVAHSREILLTLLGAVGCVLLITCANLANLLLARATARDQEIRVRLALGAGRGRVVRQLLTESGVLSLGGGLLGLALAWFGITAFAGSDIVARAGAYGLALDWRLMGFALALSAAAGLLFGMMPALEAGRSRTGRSGETTRWTTRRSGARGVLVVTEIALTLVLLIGAGLLARSFVNLVFAPKGFETNQIMTFDLSASPTKYPTPPDQTRLLRSVLEKLAALPGVSGAAFTSELPLGGSGTDGTTPVEGQTYPPDGAPDAEKCIVSPDYFRVMRIPVRKGRAFTDRDVVGTPPVAIVNEAFARKFLAGEDPLRHRIGFNWDMDGWQQVIGVVGDLKEHALDDLPMPTVYVSYLQRPVSDATFVVGSAQAPTSLAPAIRQAVWSLDPDRPVSNLWTMDAVVARSLAGWRLTIVIAAAFALLGLVLATTGVAGVVSYLTRQRSREFGIRLALGATSREILTLALARGLQLAAVGVALGVTGALVVSRVLAGLLYGVQPTDTLTFVVIAGVLLAATLGASYVPARRAVRIDPATVLRTE